MGIENVTKTQLLRIDLKWTKYNARKDYTTFIYYNAFSFIFYIPNVVRKNFLET